MPLNKSLRKLIIELRSPPYSNHSRNGKFRGGKEVWRNMNSVLIVLNRFFCFLILKGPCIYIWELSGSNTELGDFTQCL